MAFEIRLSNVPDGSYTEYYICTYSNGDGNPSEAQREFETREEAEQVVREFYEDRAARPQDFEPYMEIEIVEL